MLGLKFAKRITCNGPFGLRPFQSSAVLWAEPPKKQQRMDPMMTQIRIERKIRKIQKEIRQLERLSHKPKPVEELTLDFQTMKQIAKHRRPPVTVAEEEQERRALLYKEWTRYKTRQYKDEMRRINAIVRDQEHALKELRLESEALYQAAVQPSNNLLPFIRQGPTETPPIAGYVAPDGDYVETTKTYDL